LEVKSNVLEQIVQVIEGSKLRQIVEGHVNVGIRKAHRKMMIGLLNNIQMMISLRTIVEIQVGMINYGAILQIQM
jgi:hypothetical protein